MNAPPPRFSSNIAMRKAERTRIDSTHSRTSLGLKLFGDRANSADVKSRGLPLVALAATSLALEARGEPLGPPSLVNANATIDSGADGSPSIAMDALDHAIVVWTSTDSLGGRSAPKA